MAGQTDERRELLDRIEARRSSIEEFLRRARPRGNRLINTAIISSAIAAVLTAGPGLGGEKFTAVAADGLSLASDTVVWRTLCIAAMLVSLVAAISTNLSRSHETAGRITVAEAVNAELEGLATLLQFGQLSLPDAVKLYQQYVAKIPFVEEHPATPQRLDSPHSSIPAGWYPADPRQPEVVRWWDGRNWTEHTRMSTYDQGPPPDPPRGADAQLPGRHPTAGYRPPAPPPGA